MYSIRNTSPAGLKKFLYIPIRSIIIPRSNHKRNTPIKKRIRHVSLEDINPNNVLGIEDPKLLEFKVKQLQEFTRNIKERIKYSESNELKIKELVEDTKEKNENDTDVVFNALMNDSSKLISQKSSIYISEKKDSKTQQTNSNTLTDLIGAVATNQVQKLAPEDVRRSIGNDKLITRALLNKQKVNWNLIVETLAQSTSKLTEISEGTIKTWLLPSVQYLSFDNINKLDAMLDEWAKHNNVSMTHEMYDTLLKELSKLYPKESKLLYDPKDNFVIIKMKEILDRLDAAAIKPDAFNLTSCITYSSKLNNFETMNYFLERFQKQYGLTPNKHTYTKIIQFYDKMGLSERAWNTFDTMKFLSAAHKPDIFAYNMMLQICDREKNYAKAIDLFYELGEINLEPNQTTFSLIAKTLASCSGDNIVSEGNADSLKLLGWKFINKMINNEDYGSIGAMMALAAYDGDVSLCRALFFKYTMKKFNMQRLLQVDLNNAWAKSINPILFNYLLLSYSKFQPDHIPLMLGWNEGATMRRNILNSVDYTGRSNDTYNIPPFLPMIEISSIDHILAESNALWNFSLSSGNIKEYLSDIVNFDVDQLNKLVRLSSTFEDFKFRILNLISSWKLNLINHKIFNHKCLVSYITIPLRLNNSIEFWDRLDTFTFKENDFDQKLLEVYHKNKLIDNVESNTNNAKSIENGSSKEITVDTFLDGAVRYISSIIHKILYDNSTFEISMKGATKFNNLDRAKQEWSDRGEFRKSANYISLDEKEKVKQDSEFAKLMVNFFVSQKKYDDALSIVLSSKRYIRWTYVMIKNLLQGLEDIDDAKSIEILFNVINKKPTGIGYLNKQIEELNLD